MSSDADRTLVWPDGSIYRITRSSADTGALLYIAVLVREFPQHPRAPGDF